MQIRRSTQPAADDSAAPLFAGINSNEIDRLFAGEARGTSHEALLRRQLDLAQSQLLRYARDLKRLAQQPRSTQNQHLNDSPRSRSSSSSSSSDHTRRNHGIREIAPPQVVSASQAFQQTLALCRRVAATDATVLIHGETGTGKEVCASVIHHASPRRDHKIVAINCAALPESLLESELFGHEAGAFTGATHQKAGLFEAAEGGTLFLDEIGEMALGVQAKFLRVLEERQFNRVGGTRSIRVNVRVLAATNRDLAEEVAAGRFRSDLYYRLDVVPVHIPPLRERLPDIPALVEHFVQVCARKHAVSAPLVETAVMDLLLAYHWPGNVRQLRNVIERLVVLCETGRIRVDDLPLNIRQSTIAALPPLFGEASQPSPSPSPVDASRLDSQERSLLYSTMVQHGWNQSAAARHLRVPRSTLRHLLKKHALQPEGPAAEGV